MHPELDLVVTLAVGFMAALALGLVTHRLRMSPIVGYLMAGIMVGPFTPGVVVKTSVAEQFAEVGVVLLMFGVGLHFQLRDLLAVRRIALPGALAQILIATVLGSLLGRAFGWTLGAGVVFGLAISVASTVVLVRVLADNAALHTPSGHVAVGWLVIEDIFTVLALVFLPALVAATRGEDANVLVALLLALLKIAALVLITWFVGGRLIPKFLGYVAATRSRELFTLAVLAVALGIGVASVKIFDASMALGAFLAGMIVAQSEFSFRAASEALPMRDAFAVLFFVSVGMLLDPRELLANGWIIAGTLAVVMVGKSLAALAVVLVLRQPLKVALSVAVALAQIGEFSFILADLGAELGILPPRANQALVAASIISITLNPLLFRLVDPLSRRLSRAVLFAASPSGHPSSTEHHEAEHSAIVIGYGPVGATVTELLRSNGIRPTVVEMNHTTVNALTERGIAAIHGDASHPEILERAGAKRARSLIFAASGTPPVAVIRAAREANPKLRILARTTYLRENPASRAAGADMVVSAEAEVALAVAERLMRELGATPDQIDRARDRVRTELEKNVEDGEPSA